LTFANFSNLKFEILKIQQFFTFEILKNQQFSSLKFEISKKAGFTAVFNQTAFCFFTAHNPQHLFSQLTAHSSFFQSYSPTKHTLSLIFETQNQSKLV
jgi:hypothetical protein